MVDETSRIMKYVSAVCVESIKVLHIELSRFRTDYDVIIRRSDDPVLHEVAQVIENIIASLVEAVDAIERAHRMSTVPTKDITQTLKTIYSFLCIMHRQYEGSIFTKIEKALQKLTDLTANSHDSIYQLITNHNLAYSTTHTDKRYLNIDAIVDYIGKYAQSKQDAAEGAYYKYDRIVRNFDTGGGVIRVVLTYDNQLAAEEVDNRLSKAIHYWSSNPPLTNEITNRISLRIMNRQNITDKIPLSQLMKDWLSKLSDLALAFLANNPNLVGKRKLDIFITVVGVGKGTKTVYVGDDTIIIYIEIRMVMVQYLMANDFFQSVPYKYFTALEKYLSLPQETSSENPYTAMYRNYSLYDVVCHEIVHGLDNINTNDHNEISKYIYELTRHKEPGIREATRELSAFYSRVRSEALAQFFEVLGGDIDGYYKNPIIAFPPSIKLFDNFNKLLSDNAYIHSENLQQFDAYMFGHIMNLTILLSDCMRAGKEIIILDNKGFAMIEQIFPELTHAINGASGMKEIRKESPGGWLLDQIKNNNTQRIQEIFIHNKIPFYSYDSVQKLLLQDRIFLILKPERKILEETFKKIQASSDVSFLKMYESACDNLRIKYRGYSTEKLKDYLEALHHSKENMLKDAGLRFN